MSQMATRNSPILPTQTWVTMNFFKADKSTQYVSVEESSECSEDQLPLRRRPSSPIVSVSRSYYFISLILFAIFPVLAIALFVLHTRLAGARIDSGFLKGFPTELGMPGSVLKRKEDNELT